MYQILIDGALLYDAVDDSQSVSEASITQEINAAAYLDLTVSGTSLVAVSEGSSVAEVLWEGKTLFHGLVTDVTEDTYGQLKVSAVSDIDRLNDVLVRPNSTDGSVGEQSPSTLGAYFQWLVTQYNSGNVGGFRIDVGVNQGNQLRTAPLSIETTDYPSVASCIDGNVLSNGGYLYYTPFSGGGTLDLYADLHEASDQLIEVGENVVSIEVTRTDDSVVTALVPYATVDGEDITISGSSESEIQMLSNAGFSVNGDAFYSDEQVAKYGYREARVEFDGATSVTELIQLAVPYLRTVMSPSVTVSVKAVDMALYKDGYDHLQVGQAVHVRSALHGIDEYMAVQDMDLDLEDPSQTSYTLGVSYDTLTGQQSAFLSKLNGSINGALDKVTGLEDTINKVVNDSNVEYYVSTSPDEPTGGEWGVAVVTPTDNRYVFSHTKNELVDGTIVTSDPTLVTPSITRSLQLHRDFGTDGYTWVNFIAANYDVTDEAAGVCRIVGQMGGWDADKQGAVTVAFGFQDSAYSTGSGSMAGVGVVSEKSSDIDLDATDILSFVDNGRVSVFVRCKGQVTVNLYAEGDGFSTPFVEQATQPGGTQVFDLADVQTTYDSAILKADNAIRAYVAATYATQDALGEVQSTFDLRANQIEASVEEKMDTSVANETFVDKSTYTQFSDSITQTVESVQQTAENAQQTADSMSILVDTGEASVVQAGENAGMQPYEVDVYGATRQNLWVNPSGTSSGVTVTSNEDGSMTLSGTASSTAFIIIMSYVIEAGKTYVVTANKQICSSFVDGKTGAKASIQELDADGASISDVYFAVPGVLSRTFKANESTSYVFFRIIVYADTEMDVSDFRVMLREATEDEIAAAQQTASTLQGGGTADLSQDYPVTLPAEPSVYATSNDFDWCPPGINGVEPTAIVVSQTENAEDGTSTPIDMQGNALYSLPDGTRDELRIDNAGKICIAESVGLKVVSSESDIVMVLSNGAVKVISATGAAQNRAGLLCDKLQVEYTDANLAYSCAPDKNGDVFVYSNSWSSKEEALAGMKALYPLKFIYKLSEPQTVDLGTIDLPALPASSANVWAVSDIPATVRMLYYGTNAKALTSYATKAELKITSDSITSTVSEVSQRVDTAQSTADSAQTAASGAQSTADAAQSAATSAQSTATQALTKATEVEQTATSISATVSEVSQTATEALTKASTVEQTVDGVQVTLTTTTQTANDAKTAAQAAQSSADAASTAAGNAQSTANSAASAASTAQSAAETAQTAADAAQSAADEAQQTATDAEKVATNYLKFDSSGLCIGNMTGTLGYNALITSSQYQIRNGSTVLSSFGASQVQLGQNTSSASVTMCGGKGSIRYGSGSTSWGSTRDYLDIRGSTGANVLLSVTGSNDTQSGAQTAFVELDGPSQAAAIAGKNYTDIGTSKVNSSLIRLLSSSIEVGNNGSSIRGIYVGTKVVSATTYEVQIFSTSEYTSIVGRSYVVGDAVLVMNGDGSASTSPCQSAFYRGGSIFVNMGTVVGGQYRINYLIVATS